MHDILKQLDETSNRLGQTLTLIIASDPSRMCPRLILTNETKSLSAHFDPPKDYASSDDALQMLVNKMCRSVVKQHEADMRLQEHRVDDARTVVVTDDQLARLRGGEDPMRVLG